MRNRILLACALFSLLAACGSSSGAPASADPQEIALVRIEPANGESAVPRNRTVRIFLSEAVLPESVDDQSALVRIGGTTRPQGAFLITGDLVEFDPTVGATGGRNAAGFPAGEQVVIKIPLKMQGDGVPDEMFLQNVEGNPITMATGGNFSAFVTGSGWTDTVAGAPGVLGLEFTPVADPLGRVLPNAAVTVVFSEPVDPATFRLGKNIFLTNNTPTAPPAVYQQDVPSLVFYDGSLTRYTLQPVFGFGQGPYKMLVSFIDPDAPSTFQPDLLPADLGGNPVVNSTFFGEFDTLFDPAAPVFGVLTEDFRTTANRDATFTDALWGNDPEFPFELVSQHVTKRVQNANFAAIRGMSGGVTSIDNPPQGPGEEDYCPTQNPLVGTDSIIAPGNPPASAGRRQLNLYRQAELGARGTVIRIAWGPDSDATFAATYPGTTLRLGHKRAGTDLANASMFSQFDVDGYVTVVGGQSYAVPQAFDVNGGAKDDGYLDWPKLEVFFDYDGQNDLLLDIEAAMGNTFQTFRTFLAVNSAGICSCFNFGGCVVNNTIGLRQMDSVYGLNTAIPAPGGFVFNPAPIVHVMQFEMAKLRSDARSRYYDTAVTAPDYLAPLVSPLVQSGGASIAFSWSASHDGVVEDVPFSPNMNACDGHRYVRWSCVLRANLFTGARARVELVQIPFQIP